MRRRLGCTIVVVLLSCGTALAADYAELRGASFSSVLPISPKNNVATLRAYHMQTIPVTNSDYIAFVRSHPDWQRGKVSALFADSSYLRHWEGPTTLGQADPRQPVVHVSWFAAMAYCEAQEARLPTWHEWEWAAAANETRADARADAAWRQQVLNWYSTTGGAPLARVAQGRPNVHGIYDLHGLIWEWVEDFGAMMVSGDNREQGDPDLLKFCGSGALSMAQKEQYAVLMRIAMLSSLQASYTTANLGFRCVRTGEVKP